LLEKNRAKYAERLDELLKRHPVWWTVGEAQKVTGNLAHIQIVVHGDVHTQSLWADLATMEGHDLAQGTRTKTMEERQYKLSGRSVLNMRWWADVLKHEQVGNDDQDAARTEYRILCVYGCIGQRDWRRDQRRVEHVVPN
jgi:hypothetical protein